MADSIIINKETCRKCGLCTEVCPNKIIKKDSSGEPIVQSDKVVFCMECGQCMAVCASKSINSGNLSYDKDFFDIQKNRIDESGFFDLIQTRRAIRNFQEKPVPKEVLEKIVSAIAFAPPGFTPLKTELVVVSNPDLIKKSLPYMIDLYDYLANAWKNPIAKYFIKRNAGKKKFKLMENHLIPLLNHRLPALKAGTEDTITRNAPAMIFFLAEKKGEDITEDIFIAATYGMLAAHSMGLGGSIMSIIPPAVDKKPELRKIFNIPDTHEVVSCITIGYPKYKYSRGIKRELKSVKWL